MLHYMGNILVCYGGHFEPKMADKIQKSSDLGEIISCYVLTLFFIQTTSTCIVRLGDICNALLLVIETMAQNLLC